MITPNTFYGGYLMNTSKVIHQAKLNDCANVIREQQANSLSVAQWCEQNQLSKTQFLLLETQAKRSVCRISTSRQCSFECPRYTTVLYN